MDLVPEWSSQMEMDHPSLIQHLKMKSSMNQSVNYLSFCNPLSSEGCSNYPIISADTPESSQAGIVVSSSNLRFCTSLHETFKKPSSSPASGGIISFRRGHQQYRKPKFTVKKHTEIMGFSSTGSPASYEELYQCGPWGYDQPIKRACTRTPLQAKDHVLAERKRREKLLERFISLSALIPGLKKLDKSSVIDGAINYLKQLEARLKNLEGTKLKHDQDSWVSAKKPRLCYHEEDSSSSGENFNKSLDQSLTNIEVRISEGKVLVRACCRRRNTGLTDGFICEMEKLDLSIKSIVFMPFGDSMLAITAVAQMNDGFCMKEEDLARNIRLAILNLI